MTTKQQPVVWTGEVHPFAEMFPMLPPDELQSLADAIKASGLRDPILLDGEGVLLDGRNRLKACEIADVEPTFVSVNGADADELILDKNIERRHLSTGQRAMAIAMRLVALEGDQQSNDIAAKKPPRRGLQERLAISSGTTSDRVKLAKFVVRHDPDNAPNVLSGQVALAAAYEQAKTLKESRESEAALMAELQAAAPELATLVIEQRLPFSQAWAAYKQQRKEFDDECRRTTGRFSESVGMLFALLVAEDEERIGDRVLDHWKRDYVRTTDTRPVYDVLTPDGLRETARRLAVFAEKVAARGIALRGEDQRDDAPAAI